MDLSVIINSIQAAINSAPITASPSIAVKKSFQEALSEGLTRRLRYVKKGGIEYKLSNVLTDSHNGFNDKCDIFVETERYILIVELDTTRADQVAKKMLSRLYYADKCAKPTIYVCLLYPGTNSMNPNECVKYMHMGKDVLLSMNSANRFIGGFINGNSFDLKLIV